MAKITDFHLLVHLKRKSGETLEYTNGSSIPHLVKEWVGSELPKLERETRGKESTP